MKMLGEKELSKLTDLDLSSLKTLKEDWTVEHKNDEDKKECARSEAFRHADQHDQSDLNISKSRTLKGAEELEIRVMNSSMRVLGEEHSSTLSSMINLALTYRGQGRWKEAEELEVKKTTLDHQHSEVRNRWSCRAGRWERFRHDVHLKPTLRPKPIVRPYTHLFQIISADTGSDWRISALLLRGDALEPLYEKALRKLRFEKVERNFAKLLQKFAVELTTEAKTIPERHIAQFIKKRAKRVASCVGKHFSASSDENRQQLYQLNLQSVQRENIVERFLQQQEMNYLYGISTTSQVQDVDISLAQPFEILNEDFASDDSEPLSSEKPDLRNVEGVRLFITKSYALQKFGDNFQGFINGIPDKEPRPALNVGSPEINKISFLDMAQSTSLKPTKSFQMSEIDSSTSTDIHERIEETDLPMTSIGYFGSISRAFKMVAEFLELLKKPLRPGHQRIKWKCVNLSSL